MIRACGIFLLVAVLSIAQTPPHPSVTLNWTWTQGTGDPATGFRVYRSAVSGGPYTTPLATVPVGTLTYLDTNVTPGSTWYYVVSAINPGGESPKSNEATAILPYLPPLPIVTAPTVIVR